MNQFLISAFFEPAPNFPALKAMGVNTVAGPEPTGTSQAAFAIAAAALGLNVILKHAIAPLPANCIGLLMDADESNEAKGNNPPIAPAVLKADFDALRKLSPTLPIYMTIGGDRCLYDGFPNPVDRAWWMAVAAFGDITFVVDFYSASRSSKYPMTHTATAIKNIKALTGKRCHAFQECSDQRLDAPKLPETNGAPTPQQIHDSVTASIAAGIGGLWWFFTCTKIGWPIGYLPLVDRHGVSLQPQYDAVKSINLALNPAPVPAPTVESLAADVNSIKSRLDKLEGR